MVKYNLAFWRIMGVVGLQCYKPQWGLHSKDPGDIIKRLSGLEWWGVREVICPCGGQAELAGMVPAGMVKFLP